MASYMRLFEFEGRTYFTLDSRYYNIHEGRLIPTTEALRDVLVNFYLIGIDPRFRAIFVPR